MAVESDGAALHPGAHIFTRKTEAWSYVQYTFPTNRIDSAVTSECADGQDEGRGSVCKGLDVHIYGGGGDIGAQPLRFMFEAFSGSSSGRGALCDNTWLDDIIITKATQMEPPTDPVCPPESPIAAFSAFKFNLDPADDKSGLRGWDCCVQVKTSPSWPRSWANFNLL
jgi:hypothetical protein